MWVLDETGGSASLRKTTKGKLLLIAGITVFAVAGLAPHPSAVHEIDGRRWCAPSVLHLLPGDPGPTLTRADRAELEFDLDCARNSILILFPGIAVGVGLLLLRMLHSQESPPPSPGP